MLALKNGVVTDNFMQREELCKPKETLSFNYTVVKLPFYRILNTTGTLEK